MECGVVCCSLTFGLTFLIPIGHLHILPFLTSVASRPVIFVLIFVPFVLILVILVIFIVIIVLVVFLCVGRLFIFFDSIPATLSTKVSCQGIREGCSLHGNVIVDYYLTRPLIDSVVLKV